jgi:hypothetical protein
MRKDLLLRKKEFIIEELLQVHLKLQLFTMTRTKDIKE